MNTLRLDRAQHIARITLARPAAGNAINIEMAQELLEAAILCDEDPEIRCVILASEGKFFCLGGDVAEFAAAGAALSAHLKRITSYLHAAITRLARMNKPLITQIQGAAAGAGFSLAILGDFAVAAQSAGFTMAYSGLGFSPDGGSTWLLPRLVGMRQAQRLALRRTKIDAAEALRIGLISETVLDADLPANVSALAAELASAAPTAIGPTRALLQSSFQSSLEAQMEAESRAIAAAGGSPHGAEGIAAFLARRTPDFTR